MDGLFGALIVKPKSAANTVINDAIMHVGDWFHSRGSEVCYITVTYHNSNPVPLFKGGMEKIKNEFNERGMENFV